MPDEPQSADPPTAVDEERPEYQSVHVDSHGTANAGQTGSPHVYFPELVAGATAAFTAVSVVAKAAIEKRGEVRKAEIEATTQRHETAAETERTRIREAAETERERLRQQGPAELPTA